MLRLKAHATAVSASLPGEMGKEERHIDAHTTAAFISLGLRIVVLLALGSGP